MSKSKVKQQVSEKASEKLWDSALIKGSMFCFLITIVTFFIYKESFGNEFVNWDDQVYVEEQPLVLKKEYSKLWKTPVSLNYHPITMTSLAWQVPKDIKKLKAAPFIKMNDWLHIINSLLVFAFIVLISNSRWLVAFFTAMVFALHPMHVESVVWISERKDVLYTFFLLLSCIAYWKYLEKFTMKWLVLAGLFFILSVLSKAMAVIIPIIWILLDILKERSLIVYKPWLEKLPFFVVSLFFGLMTISVQSGGDFGGMLTLAGEKSVAVAEADVFTLWQRFQFASYGFVQYIIKFFYPLEICAFYPYPDDDKLAGAGSLLYPLAFISVMAVAVYSFMKRKVVTFGVGFYFVTVALVLQFMSVGLAIMADRYSYVPYIGLAFMLFSLVDERIKEKGNLYIYGFTAMAGVFVIFLTFKTKSQIEVWKNSENLWTQVLQYYPKEDLALANRGNNRGKTGNIPGAMEDFEIAIADGCQRADVYEGLGNSYGTMSDQQPEKKQEFVNKAISMYKKALEIDPTKGNIFYNLGIAQLQTNPAESMKAFTDALKIMPYKEGDILPVLGMSQLNAGRYQDAITTLTKAIDIGVGTDNIYYHRGLSFIGAGDNTKAIADIKKALEINPNNADARKRLLEL